MMASMDDAHIGEIIRRTHDDEAVVRSEEDRRYVEHCHDLGYLDCRRILVSGTRTQGLKVMGLTALGKAEYRRRFEVGD